MKQFPFSSLKIKIESVLLVVLLVLEVVHQPWSSSVVLGYTRDDFPSDFIFGSGTSAYQVEGATSEDGKTPSVLDICAHAGIYGGGTGDVACDGYHKYKEDVQLMVDTSLDAYRFSISWSRLIPNGRGPVNPKGLEYYNNLTNELIKNGIQPHATLLFFDVPYALQEAYGGCQNQQFVKDFTAYAEVCFKEFGDRILHWTTINEANYLAPKVYKKTQYIVGHNLLLAHGSVVKLYNEKYKAKQHGFVGLNVYTSWYIPKTGTKNDLNAVKRLRDSETGWFIHPLVYGDYPESMKHALGNRLPSFTEEESKLVKGAFDFIGVISYNATVVQDDPDGEFGLCMKAKCRYKENVGAALMQGALKYLRHAYGNFPVYIHESGFRTLRNASLQDIPRINYLNTSIGGVLDALRDGSDVRGYFQWSFLDLFEFRGAYNFGYGLYFVDMNDSNLKRHPKLSAHWYSMFLQRKTFVDGEIIQQMSNSTFMSKFQISS